ncbi:MAG: hypothetical protein WCD12_10560 [Candidatus Binatus sp.]|jgi:hypothetical protein|uniref:hypothetical protein n=1 Tax=Candidatus Binatus sp. TaxID=2811406 RepID=UPI003C72A72A
MPDALHQSKLRIDWAREKIDELKFFKQRIWQDALENTAQQGNPNMRDAYFLFRERLHDEAIRLTSEFVHHARAALDYVIFTLAWRDTGSEQKGTQFPINSTPEKFARNRERFLKHLRQEHITMVERFQPYCGFHSLLVLNTLSNLDKHREFIHINFLGMVSEVIVPLAEAQTQAASHQVKLEKRHTIQVLLDDGTAIEEALTDVLSEVGKVIKHFDRVLA